MTMMVSSGTGPSLHVECHRAGLRCHVRCRCPSRNCPRIREWIALHGLEALPPGPRARPDVYFLHFLHLGAPSPRR